MTTYAQPSTPRSRSCEKEGATQAFGLPGRGDQPVLPRDAATTAGSTTSLARHVEGASHMAEGYTRAKAGNIGVCIGTSGPAGTDMITGLYSALRRLDPDPVHHRPGAGRQAAQGGLPGRRHRRRSPSRSTKWAMTVLEPAQVPGAFQQAFHLMRSGRPGPGADRPADRRADDRDRVRHRHLRAAAGLQAGRHPGPGREGPRHAQPRPSAR